MLRTLSVTALVLFALAPSGAGVAAAPKRGLCRADEQVIFSCHIRTKVASLCGSKTLNDTEGYLYYAFGKPGAIEVSLPARDGAWRQSVTGGVTGYSGGGLDYVRIRNNGYAYVIYSGEGRGWSREGVAVEKDGKFVANLACRDDAMGEDIWAPVYAAKLRQEEDQFDVPEWAQTDRQRWKEDAW
ncbi:MAG: hypothetical protein JWP35_1303 [Caulobacter sp.]|nr:hypothetical protein [Caulobacter sp.]